MNAHQTIAAVVAATRQAIDRLGETIFAHPADYIFRLQQEWHSAIRDTGTVLEAMAEEELAQLCHDHKVYIRCGRAYDTDGNWVKDGPVADAVERYARADPGVTQWVGEREIVTFGMLRHGERFKCPRDGERVYTRSNRHDMAVCGDNVYSLLPETEVIRAV